MRLVSFQDGSSRPTMAELKISLFLLMLLQFSGTNGRLSFLTVRAGEDAVLSCGSVTPAEHQCDQVKWRFLEKSRSTELFIRGQKHEEVKPGVSLSENCSLVLKNVTLEQVGYYTCSSGDDQQGVYKDTVLSVVTVTELRDGDTVTLSCSVSALEFCRHTVKWTTSDGAEVSNDDEELKISHSDSTANVSFTDPDQSSQFYRSLKCEVTEDKKQEQEEEEKSTPDTSSATVLQLRHIIVSLGLAALLVCV